MSAPIPVKADGMRHVRSQRAIRKGGEPTLVVARTRPERGDKGPMAWSCAARGVDEASQFRGRRSNPWRNVSARWERSDMSTVLDTSTQTPDATTRNPGTLMRPVAPHAHGTFRSGAWLNHPSNPAGSQCDRVLESDSACAEAESRADRTFFDQTNKAAVANSTGAWFNHSASNPTRSCTSWHQRTAEWLNHVPNRIHDSATERPLRDQNEGDPETTRLHRSK